MPPSKLPEELLPLAEFIEQERKKENALAALSPDFHKGRASAFAQMIRMLADLYDMPLHVLWGVPIDPETNALRKMHWADSPGLSFLPPLPGEESKPVPHLPE